MAALKRRLRPRLVCLRLRGFSLDIRDQARVENALAIVGRIKAAIEVEIGASEVQSHLFGHPLQRFQPLW